MNKYTLIDYFDVWGNENDGWDVNESCVVCNDLVITDDATDQDILNYFHDNGYLKTADPELVSIINLGNGFEVVEAKTDRPLYGVMMNY